MIRELEQAREIFLTGHDEETLAQNREDIAAWEDQIARNEALADWQDHDISRLLLAQFRDTYKDIALTLAEARDLTEQQRLTFYAQQDACLLMLSMFGGDARKELDEIRADIRKKINAT